MWCQGIAVAVLADRQAFQKTREIKCEVFLILRGWAMMPNTCIMHAHAREMHVIDRHHAWVDRSRSFGSPRPRLGFAPWGRFMGGCGQSQCRMAATLAGAPQGNQRSRVHTILCWHLPLPGATNTTSPGLSSHTGTQLSPCVSPLRYCS